jgi:hypothetical protein
MRWRSCTRLLRSVAEALEAAGERTADWVRVFTGAQKH